MKTIEMIYRVTCRYCRQAFGLMEELRRSNEKYEKIEIRFLDTERDRELPAGRKFTYVPCFYIDGEMVMEGVPTKEKIEAVFIQALQEAAFAGGGDLDGAADGQQPARQSRDRKSVV